MEMEIEKNKLLNELRGGNVFFEISAAESSQVRLPLRESVFVKWLMVAWINFKRDSVVQGHPLTFCVSSLC